MQGSQDAYKRAQKNDEKRHKKALKEIEDENLTITQSISEMVSYIEEKEEENDKSSIIIKENKELIKSEVERKRKEEEDKILKEEAEIMA